MADSFSPAAIDILQKDHVELCQSVLGLGQETVGHFNLKELVKEENEGLGKVFLTKVLCRARKEKSRSAQWEPPKIGGSATNAKQMVAYVGCGPRSPQGFP